MIWRICRRPKRYLLCYSVFLFLLFGLGLLFPSFSASALETVLSESVEYVDSFNVGVWNCRFKDNTLVECGGQTGQIYNKNDTYVREWSSILSSSSYSVVKGNYYVVHLSFLVTDGPFGRNSFPAIWQFIDNANYQAVSIKELVSDSEYSEILEGALGDASLPKLGNASHTYEIILRAKKSGDLPIQISDSSKTFLYATGTSTFRIFTWPSVQVYKTADNGSAGIEGAINDQTDQQQQQYEEQKQKEEQQEQDVEDSQSDTQDSADSAASEASDTGASLFSAFTTLVAALHSVRSSNCKLPNFSIYGLNFSNMDLCMFSVPSGLMALGSIGMVFIIVPMGIALVKQLLGLYNELFGGKG